MSKVTNALSKATGRFGLKAQKHAPEIFLVTGIISIGVGVVLACKNTLQAEEVIDRHHEKKDRIKHALEIEQENGDGEYTDQEYKRDLTVTYVQTGVDWLKLYAIPGILVIGGIACILNSHNIMRRRNSALTAAYNALAAGFAAYRQRVVEEHGEEADYMYKHGLRKEKVEEIEVGEDGKTKKVKTEKLVVDPNGLSIYARFYDDSCKQWDKDPAYNLVFLKGQQDYFNNMLKVRGHVFLNEIYDALGIERTGYGQEVGWIFGGNGDNFIDFGMYNDGQDGRRRAFVNGYENTIILDFNVDGVIRDLI